MVAPSPHSGVHRGPLNTGQVHSTPEFRVGNPGPELATKPRAPWRGKPELFIRSSILPPVSAPAEPRLIRSHSQSRAHCHPPRSTLPVLRESGICEVLGFHELRPESRVLVPRVRRLFGCLESATAARMYPTESAASGAGDSRLRPSPLLRVAVTLLVLQCAVDYCLAASVPTSAKQDTNMVDQYLNKKYKLSTSENFEEIMKALGESTSNFDFFPLVLPSSPTTSNSRM